MELTKTVQEYFDELSSESPTPGGGNVAAVCGALATSLGTMVCNLTIGKKKYADVETELIRVKEKLLAYRDLFFRLSKLDNEAFEEVMSAFKMQKENETQQNIRAAQIEHATLNAAEIPSEVLKNCQEILPYLSTISLKGNKNSLSDAGVAIALTEASAKSAYLNILINCKSLANQTIAAEILKKNEILLEEVISECKKINDSLIKEINSK
ncbi:MAG: cyclodeaminase/cyclohydrolase family protein [Melioribacteraceae bacterium]|nr:cyclodeaminase/cyclohydrolase family protein [Melioribacteraceae bacterium]